LGGSGERVVGNEMETTSVAIKTLGSIHLSLVGLVAHQHVSFQSPNKHTTVFHEAAQTDLARTRVLIPHLHMACTIYAASGYIYLNGVAVQSS
jgi:hypothetical protein